jgi:hypothetical protein
MRKLIEWGIPPEVLSYAGYGATRLRDHGTSEEAHQRNRRVEFVVLTRVPVKRGTQGQPELPPVQIRPMPPTAAETDADSDDEPHEPEPAPAEAAPPTRVLPSTMERR